MTLEEINVTLSYPLLICGLILAGIAAVWLLIRLFRRQLPFGQRVAVPMVLILLGLALAAAPPIIGKLVPIDLGPREKIVNGERHLTLNDWDRGDYSFLTLKSDAALLQMGNADVTDATLNLIKGFTQLKVLDVNNSQVTDAGVAIIAKLPALETLYLERTKVTDAGIRQLTEHPALKVIWLRGTAVTKETADTVKAGKPGRRVLIDPPKS